MMLWDIIRDFYVQYIFGGVASDGSYFGANVGIVGNEANGLYLTSTSGFAIAIGSTYDDANGFSYTTTYITMGDWLSTTFTIITLILFVFFLYVFLRWLFKVVSGLILLRN